MKYQFLTDTKKESDNYEYVEKITSNDFGCALSPI